MFFSKNLTRDLESINKKIIPSPNDFHINVLINLLIASEDHRYNHHFGFDPIAIIRAMFKTLMCNKLEGASTIEQQLVRTIIKRHEITTKRKINEIILSSIMSIRHSKKDLAYSYLNIAYYGSEKFENYYPLRDEQHLKINAQEILNSYAFLIALIKRPKPYKPNQIWVKKHQSRVNYIINRYRKLTKT